MREPSGRFGRRRRFLNGLADAFDRSFKVLPCLALPDSNDVPVDCFQFLDGLTIACLVGGQLVPPLVGVRSTERSRTMDRTAVPEAPVNEDGDASAGEDEVGSKSTDAAPEAIAQPRRVQCAAQFHLRSGVGNDSAAEVRASDCRFPVRKLATCLTTGGVFRRTIGTELHTPTLASSAVQIQPRLVPCEMSKAEPPGYGSAIRITSHCAQPWSGSTGVHGWHEGPHRSRGRPRRFRGDRGAIKLGIGRSSYEIDLNDTNADKLRKAVAPCVAAARKVGGPTNSTRHAPSLDGAAAKIRGKPR